MSEPMNGREVKPSVPGAFYVVPDEYAFAELDKWICEYEQRKARRRKTFRIIGWAVAVPFAALWLAAGIAVMLGWRP